MKTLSQLKIVQYHLHHFAFFFLNSVAAMLLWAQTASAQTDGTAARRVSTPIVFSVGGMHERIEVDGVSISETSFPFRLTAPFNRNLTFNLSTAGASARATGSASLSGLNDAVVGVRYSRRYVNSSLSMNLGFNLPSGKKELSLDELGTAIYLSQPFFAFQAPGFGQGFNVSPSVSWAFPVSDDIVLGVHGQYNVRGAYAPVVGMDELYDPGNEFVLGVGFDVRLSSNATLSGDGGVTIYWPDRLAAAKVFEAGDKGSFNLMFRRISEFNELRVAARYVGRSPGTLAGGQGGELEVQTLPNLAELVIAYRWRAAEAVYLGLNLSGQQFGESSLYGIQNLGTARLLPTVRLSDQIDVVIQAAMTFGSFTGFDAGGGLRVSL